MEMRRCVLLCAILISFITAWNVRASEPIVDTSATRTDTKLKAPSPSVTVTGSFVPREPKAPAETSSDVLLFRQHSPKYYPPKETQTAVLLSAVVPGLGQTYAGQSEKGLAFLVAGVGLIAAAGFNLDRAVHYNDLADRFGTGFYDPHGGSFLTADQGHVKSRTHAQFGVLFLAAGVGVYAWNVLDAAKTVEQYNERRFPVQAQQTVYGEPVLTVSHRF